MIGIETSVQVQGLLGSGRLQEKGLAGIKDVGPGAADEGGGDETTKAEEKRSTGNHG
jgi:hypothetical protein